MRHCQIQCNFGGIDDLCKLGKRIFNCTDMQIMHFILDKILKLLTYHTPFYHQSLQRYLISKKTVRFFGPPCINYGSSLYHFRDKARSPSDRHTVWWEKTGMVWLPDGEKSVMTGFAVSIEYRRVTDRQTDRHLATASALYIASRCKKLFDMQYTSVGAVTARIIKRLTLL